MLPLNEIALYGRDLPLLERRRRVLERSGYNVSVATEWSSLERLMSSATIDLLLLCHTLSMEDCGRAITLAHRGSPEARCLILTAGSSLAGGRVRARRRLDVLRVMEGAAPDAAAMPAAFPTSMPAAMPANLLSTVWKLVCVEPDATRPVAIH